MEYIYCDLAIEVAKYLTPKDISTCCRVSLHWREVFGSNEVWQRLCDSEIEEYLRTTPCVVEPIFQLPQHNGTSLPPLSQWKAAFLREQHLWTNWQNRNFKTVEYDLGNEKNSTEKFVTNDLIMRFLPNSVELWDVRADRPVLKDTISFGKTRWYTPTVLENGFVTLKGYYNDNGNDHYFTEIFKVNQNERSVTLKWYIERNGKELSLRPGCSEESVKNRFCSVKELNIVITPGGKCIGYLSYPSSNPSYPGGIMHSFCVWDLENGVELRKESLFLPDCYLIIEGCKSSSNQCEDVVVILPYPFSTPDRSGLAFGTLEFQVYNVNNLKFFPFKKRCTYIDQVSESEYESDYESEYESEYEPDSEKKCREDRTFWVITDGFLALSDCGREGREAKEFIRIFNYQTGHELYKTKGRTLDYTILHWQYIACHFTKCDSLQPIREVAAEPSERGATHPDKLKFTQQPTSVH
ncbi:uncharacterized protein LOC128993177 [Macrosteles quadrilineatus]|uniref:uncharacterized protein LOC128993177 n=1 Tax=Macrosteles quadrilineatus TaxID=74068 RepID=UPI0023E2D602|nr:uncharacterized protein LOC128993177 [Macrosteles quadrilineatus]